MKKAAFILVLIQVYVIQNAQIIADHTVVDRYDNIPQQYIDSVKKMLVFMAGESHSGAYRHGQVLLELLDGRFQVETYTSEPVPASSDQYLRIGRPFTIGESSFFNQGEIEVLKSHITDQNNTGNPYDVMGFGWCWDMTWVNPPGGGMDPVYLVHWAGSSSGGPEGNMRWGLDSEDEALTGNSVCMDTYLEAVGQYVQYCESHGYPTQWIFTTGPVDGSSNDGTEQGFQRELKHDHIRNYVQLDASRILFDYADILCWNNEGEKNLSDWNDGGTIRSHAQIHPDNLMDYDESFNVISGTDQDEDHIGEVGALRLAKAMWWLLARISGWEDNTNPSAVHDGIDSSNPPVYIYADSDFVWINNAERYIDGQISLYDLRGRLIDHKGIHMNKCFFSTSTLGSGLYLVVLSKESDYTIEKVIIP
jgi:hypothetical protein